MNHKPAIEYKRYTSTVRKHAMYVNMKEDMNYCLETRNVLCIRDDYDLNIRKRALSGIGWS